MKKSLAALLSLYLLLFLVDSLVSVVDDALGLWLDFHAVRPVRGVISFAVLGLSCLLYLLWGAIPAIPRWFGVVVLFNFVAGLAVIPISIYHFSRIQLVGLIISVLQLAVGVTVAGAFRSRLKAGWQLVAEETLQDRLFSAWRLLAFVGLNLFLVLPGLLGYLAGCGVLAVDHFSAGFVKVDRTGFSVRARTYSRADGKSIRLVPMMHIAEADFYRRVSQSFDTNATVLLEGVSDRKSLLKHHLSYERMAGSLGLAEQQEKFTPTTARVRPADLDVEAFSPSTIEFLNLVILVHSKGLTAETLPLFVTKTQNPALVERLWDDLLTLRNRHLVDEIQRELAHNQAVIIPWGAAHMPGVARHIEELGFNAGRADLYSVVKFHTLWDGLLGRRRPGA
ncbi:MAG: hypothetical protein U1G07_02315 [Verrucomicrobiota bacterium]